MPKFHFTDLAIRALPHGTGQTYWDTTTPAFGIRVGKSRKTWIVMRGKTRSRTIIGHYPSIALQDARKDAKRLLVDTPEPTIPIRFATAKAEFLEDNYRDARPRTKKEAKRLLQKHFASLDTLSLTDVDDTLINDQLSRLADRPSEQLHAYRAIRCFLRWCTRPPRRYIAHSPMEGYLPPSKDRKGTRTLSDDELKAVWNACTGQFGDMIKLLILWGTRRGETAAIRREWIEDGILTIPSTHTKNKRPHAIPLLPIARSILDNQKTNSAYFFPARWDNDSHFNDGSWGKPKKLLEKASGVSGWQIRDIRRTFRSNMPRLGIDRPTAEILLNHAPSTLDEIYDRYERIDEKRAALGTWERHLQRLVIQ